MPPRKMLLSGVVSGAYWGKNSYEHTTYNEHTYTAYVCYHSLRAFLLIFLILIIIVVVVVVEVVQL